MEQRKLRASTLPVPVLTLDADSAKQKTYPYWHQAGFERNPTPV